MSKKVYYYGQKDLDGLKWIAKLMDFGVSLEVVIAINEARNACVLLQKRKDLYRQTVKQNSNAALKAMTLQEAEIKSLMIDKKFWEEYSDPIVDLANADITNFRSAIYDTLEESGCKNSELISHIETARVLMDMSIKQWDTVIEEAHTKYGRDYSKEFDEYRLTKVFFLWDKVCEELYTGVSVDLNNARIDGLFKEMCDKFAEGRYVEDCLKEAQKTNPDFANAVVVKEE